jgi:hypothetical protein
MQSEIEDPNAVGDLQQALGDMGDVRAARLVGCQAAEQRGGP